MKVDGIILIATHLSQEHRKLFQRSSIPILIVAQESDDCACIINDDYHAGYEVGKMVGENKLDDVIYLARWYSTRYRWSTSTITR